MPTRRVDWLVLGVVAGIGWWTSPHILYFLLPSALWLLSRRSLSVLRQGWIVLPAFVLGAMPWLAYNITNGWLSVTGVPNSTDGPLDRLEALLLGGLPISLGAKVPFTEEWIGPVIGPLIYVVGLAAIITACVIRRTSRPIYLWLLTAFPILFLSIPAEAYVGSGRYFFVLGPPIAMALSGLFRGDRGRVVVIVVCIAITTVGLVRMRDLPVSFVPDVDPLVAALDQADIEHVVAGFWLAYKLNWETGEEVVATSIQVNRYQAYTDEVRRAELVAYVYNDFDPSQVESAEAMRLALDSEDVRYVDLPVDGYTVLVPGRVVLPEEVPESALPTP